ncbi:hypothetical protein AURANDRAFT_72729, partial [Aureococcus anophagefferens]
MQDRQVMMDGPKALARARAAHILSRKFANRDRVKAKLLEDQEIAHLVAENERLDEENKVRLAAEARQVLLLEKQRVALKQQVIVRALREDTKVPRSHQHHSSIHYRKKNEASSYISAREIPQTRVTGDEAFFLIKIVDIERTSSARIGDSSEES